MTTYTVQSTDTLGKIAKAHNTTVENLVKLNNITDPNSISIGQKLNLGEVSQPTNTPAQTPEEKPMFGFDTFQNENKSNESSTYVLSAALIEKLSARSKVDASNAKRNNKPDDLNFNAVKDGVKKSVKETGEKLKKCMLVSGVVASLSTGACIGSAFGPVGTVAGGIVGGIAGGVAAYTFW